MIVSTFFPHAIYNIPAMSLTIVGMSTYNYYNTATSNKWTCNIVLYYTYNAA